MGLMENRRSSALLAFSRQVIDQMAFFVMGNKAFPLAPLQQQVLHSLCNSPLLLEHVQLRPMLCQAGGRAFIFDGKARSGYRASFSDTPCLRNLSSAVEFEGAASWGSCLATFSRNALAEVVPHGVWCMRGHYQGHVLLVVAKLS